MDKTDHDQTDPTPATLDARGLLCPLPVLRARRLLQSMPAGATLVVTATDPTAARDFEAFCAATGHRLTGTDQHDGVYRFRIVRADAS